MSKKTNWEEFFERHRDYTVMAGFYECRRDFSLEELYQAFKARLQAELKASGFGLLVDRQDD